MKSDTLYAISKQQDGCLFWMIFKSSVGISHGKISNNGDFLIKAKDIDDLIQFRDFFSDYVKQKGDT